MVNLLLTGRAACNVFNDVTETEDNVVMKGIQGRSEVGVLALAEHYKAGKVSANGFLFHIRHFGYVQVGTYLKTPRLPIWLIHSEKHFSVLFSLKKELLSDWKAERRFDLFYYDGLGRQQQEIRLTVGELGTLSVLSHVTFLLFCFLQILLIVFSKHQRMMKWCLLWSYASEQSE